MLPYGFFATKFSPVLCFCLQSYRKAVTTARRDKKGQRATGLTEEQKQEIRSVQHALLCDYANND